MWSKYSVAAAHLDSMLLCSKMCYVYEYVFTDDCGRNPERGYLLERDEYMYGALRTSETHSVFECADHILALYKHYSDDRQHIPFESSIYADRNHITTPSERAVRLINTQHQQLMQLFERIVLSGHAPLSVRLQAVLKQVFVKLRDNKDPDLNRVRQSMLLTDLMMFVMPTRFMGLSPQLITTGKPAVVEYGLYNAPTGLVRTDIAQEVREKLFSLLDVFVQRLKGLGFVGKRLQDLTAHYGLCLALDALQKEVAPGEIQDSRGPSERSVGCLMRHVRTCTAEQPLYLQPEGDYLCPAVAVPPLERQHLLEESRECVDEVLSFYRTMPDSAAPIDLEAMPNAAEVASILGRGQAYSVAWYDTVPQVIGHLLTLYSRRDPALTQHQWARLYWILSLCARQLPRQRAVLVILMIRKVVCVPVNAFSIIAWRLTCIID